jgi:hypothetical protein
MPQIYYKIKWLNVELVSMKHILLRRKYPTLSGIGLCNMDSNKALNLFHSKNFDDKLFF